MVDAQNSPNNIYSYCNYDPFWAILVYQAYFNQNMLTVYLNSPDYIMI